MLFSANEKAEPLLGPGRTWDRAQYFAALEAATVDEDPIPFARLIAGYVREAVDGFEET